MIPIRTGRQASRGGIPGGVAVVLEGITSLYPLHIDQDVSIRMKELLALTKPVLIYGSHEPAGKALPNMFEMLSHCVARAFGISLAQCLDNLEMAQVVLLRVHRRQIGPAKKPYALVQLLNQAGQESIPGELGNGPVESQTCLSGFGGGYIFASQLLQTLNILWRRPVRGEGGRFRFEHHADLKDIENVIQLEFSNVVPAMRVVLHKSLLLEGSQHFAHGCAAGTITVCQRLLANNLASLQTTSQDLILEYLVNLLSERNVSVTINCCCH